MNSITQFRSGLSHSLSGFQILKDYPSIKKYLYIPYLICLISVVLYIILAWTYFGDVYTYLLKYFVFFEIKDPMHWYEYFFYIFLIIIRGSAHIIFGLFLFVLSIIAMYFLTGILSSPFLELISEKMESALTGKEEEVHVLTMIKNSMRSVWYEIERSIFFIIVPLFFFIINLIPGIGSILYIFLTNFFLMWVFGFNFVDFSLARKGISFKERLSFARKNLCALLGFGVICVVPFVPLLCMPILVANGTKLFIELTKEQ